MKYIDKEEVQELIKDTEDIDLILRLEHIANKIMGEYSTKDGLVSEEIAKKIINSLKESNKIYEKYLPETIFDSSYFMPDEIMRFIDKQLQYIKKKYKSNGLILPFKSLNEAHSWLIKERTVGVLNLRRLSHIDIDPDMEREAYIGSLILMPYRYRTNKEGLKTTDNLICNYSIFLIELNSIISSLAHTTGIDNISILSYFLTDEPIEIYRVKASTASDCFNQYMTIQINTNDLTKEEWLEIYDEYRVYFNQKHKKKLSDKNILLIQVLEQMGYGNITAPPSAKDLRSIISKWNEVSGDNMDIENWRAMRRRIESIIKFKNSNSAFQINLNRIN